MQWSEITFAPPPRLLRQFAGLWLLIFAGLAVVQGIEEHPVAAVVLGGVALLVGLPGLVKPALVRPIYAGATVLTFPIGWIVSKLVLACLYFGLFTPVGLMFRLIGRDVLGRRPRLGAETYWAPKSMPTEPNQYFRPF